MVVLVLARAARSAALNWAGVGGLLLAVGCGSTRSDDNAAAPGGKGDARNGSMAGTRSGAGGTLTNAGGASGGTAGDVAESRGGSGGGTSSAGSGGSRGSEASIDVPRATEVCKEYLLAQCTRIAECSSSGATPDEYCLGFQRLCPEIFLGHGAGYTIESLTSCGAEWKTFSCDRFKAGERPACTRSGTRAVGEPCRLSTQCASGACSSPDASQCGKCLAPAASGESCEVFGQCSDTHLCAFGRCLQLQAWSPEQQLPNGAACTYDGKCTGACAPSSDGDRCVDAPRIGEACLMDLPSPGARRCAWGASCSPEGICQSVPSSGPCAAGLVPCSGANFCDSPTGFAPGTCKPWLPIGAECNPAVVETCGENDRCQCDDASCASAHCVRYVSVPGYACDEFHRCAAGTSCVNGVCSAVDPPFWPDECRAGP